jgi:DNA-binding LacI/PurR family transcriptional regulator
MGIMAAALVIAQIQKTEIENRHPVLPVSLTVRASSAPPA